MKNKNREKEISFIWKIISWIIHNDDVDYDVEITWNVMTKESTSSKRRIFSLSHHLLMLFPCMHLQIHLTSICLNFPPFHPYHIHFLCLPSYDCNDCKTYTHIKHLKFDVSRNEWNKNRLDYLIRRSWWTWRLK